MNDIPIYDVKTLSQIHPQTLLQLEKSLSQEIQYYSQAFQSLKVAYERLLISQSVLEPLKKEKESDLFIPLTSSLYIKAKKSSDQLLVDLGTGYFVEKDIKGSQEILKRKSDFVKISLDQIQMRISYQKQNLMNCQTVLNSLQK